MMRSKEELLRFVAPGTEFREGIDNILKARTGGLLVVGYGPSAKKLIHGGFEIDSPYSAASLYELAKMDGAIILSEDTRRILLANAELNPDPSIFTRETGIRHRSAERFANQTGELVIAVSQRRAVITLYQGKFRYVLKDLTTVFTKANQVLQRLEKVKSLFETELEKLTQLEINQSVTLYDVLQILAQSAVILQLKQAILNYVQELGNEGVLLDLHVRDSEVEEQTLLFLKDYMHPDGESTFDQAFVRLQEVVSNDPSQLREGLYLKLLGYPLQSSLHDKTIVPLGFRVLDKIHRLPTSVIENVIESVGNLNAILEVSSERLNEVEGVGEVRAQRIKAWLDANKRKRILM